MRKSSDRRCNAPNRVRPGSPAVRERRPCQSNRPRPCRGKPFGRLPFGPPRAGETPRGRANDRNTRAPEIQLPQHRPERNKIPPARHNRRAANPNRCRSATTRHTGKRRIGDERTRSKPTTNGKAARIAGAATNESVGPTSQSSLVSLRRSVNALSSVRPGQTRHFHHKGNSAS